MTREQQLIDGFYSNDNTKTISDLIEDLRLIQQSNNMVYTEKEIKDNLKSSFTDITDWSF